MTVTKMKSLLLILALSLAACLGDLASECADECRKVSAPEQIVQVAILHDQMHAVCQEKFKHGAQVGHACRTGFGDVGQPACELGCTDMLSGHAVRNSPKVAAIYKLCKEITMRGGTPKEVESCRWGLDKGSEYFGSKGRNEIRKIVESTLGMDLTNQEIAVPKVEKYIPPEPVKPVEPESEPIAEAEEPTESPTTSPTSGPTESPTITVESAKERRRRRRLEAMGDL